ncbi:MAG: hypothetical protein A2283_06120 [Lentisphaerae bacterium RIFOXYA12_FULL_48_11]|nr:MAG: hypothetical protein A2283_06120 [Lentisphaerae bacterium RIFOXYA12_FULL_48_11]
MPTPEQVDKAIEIMSRHSVNVRYFFSTLDDPSWITPLRDRGLLRDVPSLVADENGNLHGTHIWPQADYLKRMAKKDDRKVQAQVLEIMLGVGNTNNYFIHGDFTRGALVMPPDLAAKWAQHEVAYLHSDNPIYSILEKDLGRLVSYLAKNGEVDAALALAAELLAVFEDPEADKKKNPKNEATRIACSRLEPRIRCDKYYYEQILQKNMPDLVEVAPDNALDLLSSLLNKVIIFSMRADERTQPTDMSLLSRSTIEDSNQNYDFYFYHHLINIVRDVAVSICSKDLKKLANIVARFEGFNRDLFTRIVLYLLQIIDPVPMDIVEARLVNRALFDNISVYHEYFHLLKKRFGKLSQKGQSTILGWIEEGPDYSQRDDLAREIKEQRIRYWQYRQLCAIEAFLDENEKKKFLTLKEEFNEPGIPPDFHVWRGGMSHAGQESPKKPEELSEMSMSELCCYLKNWKPSGQWMAPTPAGLGAALSELVVNTPDEFAKHIDLFMDRDIDPTYVKYVLRGFIRALENKKRWPFEPVFKLCKWVADKQREIPFRKVPENLYDGFDVDSDWSQSKLEISRLFEGKMFMEETDLPLDFRKQAWSIIKSLTEDSDPTLEYEKEYGGNNMDPLTLSINSTRGKALHAVISYAMWLYRGIKEREGRKATFDDMPEVKTILEQHLDTENNVYGMSLADRAVYGRWLPQIVHVGSEWFKDNLYRVFPPAPEHRLLREAAWNTYLLYSDKLYHNVTRLLVDIYHDEILALKDKKIDKDTYKSPETRLAEHIVILYLWGEYGLENDSMVNLFFKTAQVDLTAHALEFLGRDTYDSKEITDPKIVQRLKDLWEWRVTQTGGVNKMPKQELSTFGWWFAGGEFDKDNAWAFKWLKETLERTGISDSNMYVFERMSEIFKDYPEESLCCLKLFMKRNDDAWFFGDKEKGIWSILEQGIKHEKPEVREASENIIHSLGTKGHLEYRELLKKNVQDKN